MEGVGPSGLLLMLQSKGMRAKGEREKEGERERERERKKELASEATAGRSNALTAEFVF
jgi:hypothetical protein